MPNRVAMHHILLRVVEQMLVGWNSAKNRAALGFGLCQHRVDVICGPNVVVTRSNNLPVDCAFHALSLAKVSFLTGMLGFRLDCSSLSVMIHLWIAYLDISKL